VKRSSPLNTAMTFRLVKIGLFFIISGLIMGCQHQPGKTANLPSDSLLNEVIATICMDTSIINPNRDVISRQLCPYTLYYHENNGIGERTPPPPPSMGIINPISPAELITFIKSKLGDTLKNSDTALLSLQIRQSKNKYLDSTYFKSFRLANITITSFKDYFRNDSIVVFSYPIFFSNDNLVYVNAHRRSHGTGLILQRIDNDWKIMKEFDTWNVD
jgi:hypothetical protein